VQGWLTGGCKLVWSHRVAALMSQTHMTNYYRKAKEHGVQWQLNRSYSLTCTPGHVAAQFNWHGNCTTATVDTVVLGKFKGDCVSKITVELTTSLPCSLMSKTEYNGECCRCLTACDVKRIRSIVEGRGKGLVNYLQLAWMHGVSVSQT